MQWLINDYLRTSEGLERIQAISLWGSEDLKIQTLSLKSSEEKILFVNKVDNCTSVSCSKRSYANGLVSYTYKKKKPCGNGFKVIFYERKSNSTFFSHFKISLFK